MTDEAKSIFPPNADVSIWEVMQKNTLSPDAEIELMKYAETMGLSVRTVQNHRARIAKKLDIQGNNGLFSFALEHRCTISRSTGKS